MNNMRAINGVLKKSKFELNLRACLKGFKIV